MKRSKNYQEALKLIDKSKTYDAKEAMDLVTKTSKAKFDETVELHVKLGVDGRNADQQVLEWWCCQRVQENQFVFW